ncbi:hypothetical protein IJH16_01560 [Candidatus Saccharibacteria bacterium]|nr:hypothetical protein [Candidatus Saccharibacteria bacterium]
MKRVRKILVLLLAVALVVGMSTTVYADDYYVETIVETVETTNGVVTGYNVQRYTTPYNNGVPVNSNGNVVYCTTNNGNWTPYWGENYEKNKGNSWTPYWGANYEKNKGVPQYATPPCYSGYPYTPTPQPQPQPVINKVTVCDEATAQAEDIYKYARDRGWETTFEDLQKSDTLVRKRISFKNSRYQMSVEQVTELLWAGGFNTTYKYNGGVYGKDNIKWTLENYK